MRFETGKNALIKSIFACFLVYIYAVRQQNVGSA